MTSAATVPIPPPNGNDFADWLSPILVKELRQGLKSRAFVAIFIVVQVAMIIIVGLQLLSIAGSSDRSAFSLFDGFFWAFGVWLPLLVMMPARGLTAVSEEIKANTLDLVQLTRLSAFRIVFGKWVALVSQTLLLVAAILPYAVLRYYFGEVDIVDDLRNIGFLLLASLGLTAGTIALSSVHLAVRIIVLVVLMPTLTTGIIPLLVFRAMGSSSTTSFPDWSWTLPLFVAVYIYLLLEVAAAKIAPISENHAAPKRLLCIGLVAATVVFAALSEEEMVKLWMVACAFPCAWVVVESLSERTIRIPSLYYSFARRGLFGRLAGRVLYPGWASGLLFCSLLTALALAAVCLVRTNNHLTSSLDDGWTTGLMFPLAFTAVISPVLVLLLFPRAKQPMWLYILVQAICALFFLIATIAEGTPKIETGEALRFLAPIPTSALFALMSESYNDNIRGAFTAVSLPVCAVIVGFLAFRAVREFRVISKLERESMSSTKPAA